MARDLSILATVLEQRFPLQELLGQPVCLLCGSRAERDGLCRGCRDALPWLPL